MPLLPRTGVWLVAPVVFDNARDGSTSVWEARSSALRPTSRLLECAARPTRAGEVWLARGRAKGFHLFAPRSRFDSAIRLRLVRSTFPVAVSGISSRMTISSGAL